MRRMTQFGEAPVTEYGGKLIAGEPMRGDCTARLLNVGDQVMAVHLVMSPGYENMGHTHPDHESLGYIVEGALEMTVGDERRVLEPGDMWYHPRGVTHSCTARVRCVAVEFHSPLREDVLALFDAPSEVPETQVTSAPDV